MHIGEVDPRDRIAYETALKEFHNIDNLVETHSRIILIISAALFAFVSSKTDDAALVVFVALFGILICIIWMLKVIRHRRIFREAHGKLKRLEKKMGIDAVRALPGKGKRLWSIDGFTLLIWLAMLIVIFWVSLASFQLLRPVVSPGCEVTALGTEHGGSVLITTTSPLIVCHCPRHLP